MARCFPGTSRRINFGEPFVFHFTAVDRKENNIKPNLPVDLNKVSVFLENDSRFSEKLSNLTEKTFHVRERKIDCINSLL